MLNGSIIVKLKKLKKFTYSIFMLSIFNSNFFGSECAFVEIIYLYFFIFKANFKPIVDIC